MWDRLKKTYICYLVIISFEADSFRSFFYPLWKNTVLILAFLFKQQQKKIKKQFQHRLQKFLYWFFFFSFSFYLFLWMYSHTLCPVSLPFPALLPQGVPCKGLCQMRVFTVVKGTTSSPRGPRSWTKPCQMMYYSPARTLLSQSRCHYGDHHILWEWNHYMVSVFPIFLLSEESFVSRVKGKCLLQQLVLPSWSC